MDDTGVAPVTGAGITTFAIEIVVGAVPNARIGRTGVVVVFVPAP